MNVCTILLRCDDQIKSPVTVKSKMESTDNKLSRSRAGKTNKKLQILRIPVAGRKSGTESRDSVNESTSVG